jgi:hypothetical protein
VTSPCDNEALARRRTVVAVVRLVVADRDQLVHGEIVSSSGTVVARFRTWEGLVAAVHSWLAMQPPDAEPSAGQPL